MATNKTAKDFTKTNKKVTDKEKLNGKSVEKTAPTDNIPVTKEKPLSFYAAAMAEARVTRHLKITDDGTVIQPHKAVESYVPPMGLNQDMPPIKGILFQTKNSTGNCD